MAIISVIASKIGVSMNKKKDPQKLGKIDISRLNNPPEKEELATAKYSSELGYINIYVE